MAVGVGGDSCPYCERLVGRPLRRHLPASESDRTCSQALKDYAPVLKTRADGWRIPSPNGPRGFGVTDEDDIAWVQSRLGDQPIRTFTQPIVLSSQILIPKTFIQCSEAPFFKEAATRAKENGFGYHDLMSAGHDAMITQPEALGQILLQV